MSLTIGLVHALAPAERRCLDRKEAASYCGVSVVTFDKMVRGGTLPQPLRFARRKAWDKSALDKTLDMLSGMSAAAAPAHLLDEWRSAHGQG